MDQGILCVVFNDEGFAKLTLRFHQPMIEEKYIVLLLRRIVNIRKIALHFELQHRINKLDGPQLFGNVISIYCGNILTGRCIDRCAKSHFVSQLFQRKTNGRIVNGIFADHVVNSVKLLAGRFISVFSLRHIVEHIFDSDLCSLVARARFDNAFQLAIRISCPKKYVVVFILIFF